MTRTDRPNCYRCSGSGEITELTTEPDYATGFALGAALGTGFFFTTKTVSKKTTCPTCLGSGKQR